MSRTSRARGWLSAAVALVLVAGTAAAAQAADDAAPDPVDSVVADEVSVPDPLPDGTKVPAPNVAAVEKALSGAECGDLDVTAVDTEGLCIWQEPVGTWQPPQATPGLDIDPDAEAPGIVVPDEAPTPAPDPDNVGPSTDPVPEVAPSAEGLASRSASTAPSAETDATALAVGTDATANVLAAEPSPLLPTRAPWWCGDGTMQATRKEACTNRGWEAVLWHVSTRGSVTIIGTAGGTTQSYIYVSPKVLHVINQTTVKLAFVTSPRVKLKISGKLWCSGLNCDHQRGDLPQRRLNIGQKVVAIGDVSPDLATGQWSSSRLNWEFTVVNYSPSSDPASLYGLAAIGRCDWAARGLRGKGCVIGDVYATKKFVATPQNFEAVWHIQRAQASGLIGSFASGFPLHRTTDATTIKANRAVACPKSLLRPEGMTCDEYPFASTSEGGARVPVPRVLAYCNLPVLDGEGPDGFSRCMINKDQNSQAGSELGAFYQNQRVWDDDPFWVETELMPS